MLHPLLNYAQMAMYIVREAMVMDRSIRNIYGFLGMRMMYFVPFDAAVRWARLADEQKLNCWKEPYGRGPTSTYPTRRQWRPVNIFQPTGATAARERMRA